MRRQDKREPRDHSNNCVECGSDMTFEKVCVCRHCGKRMCWDCISDHEYNCLWNPNNNEY